MVSLQRGWDGWAMIRYDNELYYFQYAPPTDRLEDATKGKRPSVPFTGAQPWQCSVYYFWWLFLRENEAYRTACETRGQSELRALYFDFGDVHDTDFPTWWLETGRDLFCEPRSESVQIVKQGELRYSYDADDRLLLTIDRGSDIERVLAEVRSLLRKSENKLRNKGASQALYQVFTKPVLTSLYQHHKVYTLRKSKPDAALYEIGDEAGVMTSLSPSDTEAKAMLASVTGRIVRQAERIIEYVGQGVFPVITEEHEKLVPAFREALKKSSQKRVQEVTAGPYETTFGIRRQFL
ncbi:hypothetical protein [Novosphingobium arvoryzae]|nr:hypothetical protein [Novosphingobium arvoryzae]